MDVDEELQRLTEAEPLGTTYTTSKSRRSTHGARSTAVATQQQHVPRAIADPLSSGFDPSISAYSAADGSVYAPSSSTAGDLWLLDSRRGGSMSSNPLLVSGTNLNDPNASAVTDAHPGGVGKGADEDLPTSTSYGVSQLDSPSNRASGSAESEKEKKPSSRAENDSPRASQPATTVSHHRDTTSLHSRTQRGHDALVPSEERVSKPNRHAMVPEDNCEDFDPDETASVRRRRLGFLQPTESSVRRSSLGTVGRFGGGGSSPTSVRRLRQGSTTRGPSVASNIDAEYDELMNSVSSSVPRSTRRGAHNPLPPSSSSKTASKPPAARTVQQRSVPRNQDSTASLPKTTVSHSSERTRAAPQRTTHSDGVGRAGDDVISEADDDDEEERQRRVDAARSSKTFDVPPDGDEDLYDVSSPAAPPSMSPLKRPMNAAVTTDKTATATRRQSDPRTATVSSVSQTHSPAASAVPRARKSTGTKPKVGPRRAVTPESPLLSDRSSPRGRTSGVAMRSRVQGNTTVQRSANGKRGSSVGAVAAMPHPAHGSPRGAAASGSSLTTITISDEDEDYDSSPFGASVSLSPLTSGNRTVQAHRGSCTTTTPPPEITSAPHPSSGRGRGGGSQPDAGAANGRASAPLGESLNSMEATITAVEEVEGSTGGTRRTSPSPAGGPRAAGRLVTKKGPRSSSEGAVSTGSGGDSLNSSLRRRNTAAEGAPANRSNTKTHRVAANHKKDAREVSEEPATTFPSVRKLPAEEPLDDSFDDTPMTVLKERAAAAEEERRRAAGHRTPSDTFTSPTLGSQTPPPNDGAGGAASPMVYVPPLPLSSITERRDRANSAVVHQPVAATVSVNTDISGFATPKTGTATGRHGTARWGDGTYGDLTTVTISPMSGEDSPYTVAASSPKPTAAPTTAAGAVPRSVAVAARSSSAAAEEGSPSPSIPVDASTSHNRHSTTAAKAKPAAASQPTRSPSPAVKSDTNKPSAASKPKSAEAAAEAEKAKETATGPKKRGYDADAEKRGGPGPNYVPTKSEQKKCCVVM